MQKAFSCRINSIKIFSIRNICRDFYSIHQCVDDRVGHFRLGVLTESAYTQRGNIENARQGRKYVPVYCFARKSLQYLGNSARKPFLIPFIYFRFIYKYSEWLQGLLFKQAINNVVENKSFSATFRNHSYYTLLPFARFLFILPLFPPCEVRFLLSQGEERKQ